jgi:hypothetical protein
MNYKDRIILKIKIDNTVYVSRNGVDEGNQGNSPYKTIDYG